jgi:uncharacterized protein (DUF1800 family)
MLGKHYADGGVEQGRAVLDDLARNPATAQHIAQKLARHFIADEPPPALVGKLAKTFKDTDGSLKEVAKTLVTADEAWTPARTKLKRPSEWLVGIVRLTGGPWPTSDMQHANPTQWNVNRLLGAQAALGESLWRPPAPNGYPDTEAAWIDGVSHRLDIAGGLVGQLARDMDPRALLDSGLGPLASRNTYDTVTRAESRNQALALLVMTPEFLRR